MRRASHSTGRSGQSRRRDQRGLLRASVLAVPAALALSQAVLGGTLYWDANGTTAGAGTTPNGTWGVNSFWNDQADGTDGSPNGVTGYLGPWVAGSDAVFSAGSDATGAYTVTVNGTQQAATITLKDGSATLAGGEIDLSNQLVTVSASLATIASVLGGGGSLNKDGSGTLVLSGDNLFTGTTLISNGVLSIDADARLGPVPTSFTANQLQFNGATLRITANALLAAQRGITLMGSGGTIDTPAAVTINGAITDLGGQRLVKTGTGTLTLGNNSSTTGNSFQGGIDILGGVLSFAGEASANAGDTSPLGMVPASATPNYIHIDNNATLRNTKSTTAAGVSFVLANRGIDIGNNGGTFDLSSTLSYAGTLTGGGRITKVGAGDLVLKNSSNQNTGGWKISQGMVEYSFNGKNDSGIARQIGMIPTSVVPDWIILDGGTLFYNNVGQGGGTVLPTNCGITLTGNGGSIQIPDDPNHGTTTTSTYADTYFGTVSSTGGGSAVLTKTGDGELRSGSNNWQITKLVVAGGFFRLGGGSDDSTLGPVPASLVSDYITLNGTGTNRSNGGVAFGATPDFTINANRGVYIGANGATFIHSGSKLVIAGPVSGPGGVNIGGNGWPGGSVSMISFGGANTYAGTTTLNFGGMEVTGGNAIPDSSDVTLSDNTTYKVTSRLIVTNSETIGSLAGGSSATVTVSSVVYPVGGLQIPTGQVLSAGANGKSTTFGGSVTGAGGFSKVGTGTLTIVGNDWANTGPVTVSAGTMKLGDSAAGLSSSSTVTVAGGATWDMNGMNDTIGALAGAGSVANLGNLNAGGNNESTTFGGTFSGSGTLTKQGTGAMTITAPVTLTGLTVSGGQVVLASGAGTSKIGTLAVSGAQMDLTNNRLVLAAMTPSATRGLLAAGYTGSSAGDWLGNGLTSSTAAADPKKITAIGYLTAAQLGVSSWGGVGGLTGPEVLTRVSYYGDINLDGKVNADDLALMDRGMAKYASGAIPAGTAVWLNGDVNYDGAVNAADFLLADTAYGKLSGQLPEALLAERAAQFGDGYVQSLIAAVPEPASVGVVGAAAIGLLGRRRRSMR